MPNTEILKAENEKLHEVINNSVYFSPGSLLAIFNAHITVKEERKIIQVRGIFKKSGTASYGGYYYNRLKDEASDNSITLITSALIHNQLNDNKTIEFNGFITRRLDKQGRIELIINLIELTAQKINKFSEQEIKKITLINQKVLTGFVDLDAFIKNAIFHNTKLSVKIIMGKAGIINSDINKAMGEAVALYDIEYHRVSLSSPSEIISKIKSLDTPETDIICVARGGGENLQIFEDLDICNEILECKTIIASAIGHADDVSLFEKMADKKFITPTQFGSYLKDIYNSTVGEFQKSKAKIIQDTRTELTTLYNKQIENLSMQLKSTKELNDKTLADVKKNHIEQMATVTAKLKSFEEVVNKTTEEKTKLYKVETDNLKKQIEDISKIHQDQLLKMNSLQDTQIKSLNDQILNFRSEQIQKEKMINQANSLAENAQKQLKDTQGKAKLNIVAIIIAVVVGLIIGAILFGNH